MTLLSHQTSAKPTSPASSLAAPARPAALASAESVLQGHDPLQVQMMQEELIRVDGNDQVLGAGSKVDCHRVQPDGSIPLHRAFSVFLFDQDNRLLMQQRASSKITFPDVWTNTCCSHPLFTPSELEPLIGVKRAAQRKLEHELGIPASQVPLSAFEHVATIHYQAQCDDGVWGEHEVDHVLLIRAQVTLDLNLNEVRATRWFTGPELDAFRKTKTAFSPWFARIANQLLPVWWAKLERDGSCKSAAPVQAIVQM
jgi:isopentenyl-diphosphate delta-isomerase